MEATTIPEVQGRAEDRVSWNPELQEVVRRAAREAGFELTGLAGVGPEHDAADADRFSAWVADGHAGEMEYLKRRDASGRLVRSGLQVSLPWARSVLVCAISYRGEGPASTDPAPQGSGWIARYAWSGRRGANGELMPSDYHEELLSRLRTVESKMQSLAACTTRCYVDTGPMLERGLAARAGIGWIGKNTCVLNEQLGSWLLLGVIVTSLELDNVPQPGAGVAAVIDPAVQDRCGSCTRCIDACPTGALLGGKEPGSAREMDATRCIAYLTIEKKGGIEPELQAGMGRQVFGCDICQDVCPWNAKAGRRGPVEVRPGMEPRPELVNPPLERLAEMDSAEFKRRFKGSPLERTGRKRLQRNVAIAMGNSGEARFLPQLELWAAIGSQPCAGGETANANDRALAEAAMWARDRIFRTNPID